MNPTIKQLPAWKLIRVQGELCPLTKNNAMRVLLEANKGQSPAIVPVAGRRNI
jgi:hypothetical protein